jgi:hypothetical protein
MAFIPVPNAAIAHINYTWFGQQVQNTLWFDQPDDPSFIDIVNLADGLNTLWVANMLPLQSEDITFRNVEVIAQNMSPGITFTSTLNTGDIGGAATPSVSNSITLAVSFRTGVTGRSNRGRNFWLGLAATSVNDNVVSGVAISAILAAYGNLIGSGSVAGDWKWVVASRFSAGEPRITGVTSAIVSVSVVDDVIDNQRRRLPGRGV